MDNIDIQIIKLLQENARRQLSDISSKINLSLPAVSERLRKIELSQAIQQYTAIVNPKKFNKMLCCFSYVGLVETGAKAHEKFIKFIDSESDIVECHCITGEYEYFLKIITNDTQVLQDLLERIRNQAARTNSFISLSKIKQSFSITPSLECKQE